MIELTEKSKLLQYEVLMEKIRSKNALNSKPFPDLVQAVRHAIKSRKLIVDAADRNMHQRSLDLLQKAITVTTLQGLIERLECLTRQLGLKFMVAPANDKLFISADMFYLEITFEKAAGAAGDRRCQFVSRVEIHHEGGRINSAAEATEMESSRELVDCLNNRDFDDFVLQLQQLMSIYDLKTADKLIKNKIFNALVSLEDDLATLNQLEQNNTYKDPIQMIHQSSIGLLKKRSGGHPLKLYYFVSPFNFIDKERGILNEFSHDEILQRSLGSFVCVTIETIAVEGGSNKLQIVPIVYLNQNPNKSTTASYSTLTNQNSCLLPACFILKLNRPTPVSTQLLQQIEQITEIKQFAVAERPLLGLIRTTFSDTQPKSNELFVTLPDQTHCYYLSENSTMNGSLIEKIQFTHPAQIAQLIELLRQQALFNALIGTCVRPRKTISTTATSAIDRLLTFELSALNWQTISVQMQHPLQDDQLVTIEFDLSDIANLSLQIIGLKSSFDESLETLAIKSFRFSYSIPVTLRAIFRFFRSHYEQTAMRSASLNASSGNSGPATSYSNGPDTANSGRAGQSFFSSFDDQKPSSFLTKSGHDSNIKHGMLPLETDTNPDENNSSDSTATSVLSQPELDDKRKFSGNGGVDDSSNQTRGDDDDDNDDDEDDDGNDVDSGHGNNDENGGDLAKKTNVLDMVSSSVSITPVQNTPVSNMFPVAQPTSTVTITPVPQSIKPSSSSSKKNHLMLPRPGPASVTAGAGDKKRKRRRDDDSSPADSNGGAAKIAKISTSPKNSVLLQNFMRNLQNVTATAVPPASATGFEHQANAAGSTGATNRPKSGSGSGGGNKDKRFLSSVPQTTDGQQLSSEQSPSTSPTKQLSSTATTSSKNRKNTLSDVIDKLKSVQNPTSGGGGCGNDQNPSVTLSSTNISPNSSTSSSSSTASTSLSSSTSSSSSSSSSTSTTVAKKSSEYMIKPSSDGMKITINKTKSKEMKTKAMASSSLLSSSSTTSSAAALVSSLSSANNKSIALPSSGNNSKLLSATNTINSSGSSSNSTTAATLGRKTTTTPPLSKSQQSTSSIGNSQLSATSKSTASLTAASNNANSNTQTKSSGSKASSEQPSRSIVTKRLTKSSSDKSIYNSVQSTQQQQQQQQQSQLRRNVSSKDDYATASAAAAAAAAATACHESAIKMATNPVAIMLTDSLQKMNFAKNFHIPKLSARNATSASSTTAPAAAAAAATTTASSSSHRDDSNPGSDSKKSSSSA